MYTIKVKRAGLELQYTQGQFKIPITSAKAKIYWLWAFWFWTKTCKLICWYPGWDWGIISQCSHFHVTGGMCICETVQVTAWSSIKCSPYVAADKQFPKLTKELTFWPIWDTCSHEKSFGQVLH